MTQTKALKRFLIKTSVENAEGSQTWYVDAENEAEALQKYNNGKCCDIYANEVEVTWLGQPELEGETTLDDFGDFGDKALAQPEQEPVAHCTVKPLRGDESYPKTEIIWVKGRPVAGPLYTTPPQRKPLSDEEYSAFAETYTGADGLDCVDFGRAVARHYGIKE
jgi:hypothetical protein